MTEPAHHLEDYPLPWEGMRVTFESLTLTNFLSYKSATLRFGSFLALVGPNASGKSNAVSAIKLLRDIALHGLPVAISRRGGFDQLRHRSRGHPYDPKIRLAFRLNESDRFMSFYELKLKALAGKTYQVKSETGGIYLNGRFESFVNDGRTVKWLDTIYDESGDGKRQNFEYRIAPGHSAISSGSALAAFVIGQVLRSMQTVEINPVRVGELQEPSSTEEFEPDGSNTASVFDELSPASKGRLIEGLNAVVGNIADVEVARFADKITLRFYQTMQNGNRREFLAKQMSDGTLRAFSILLATVRKPRAALLVIEEPEVAIHLGALLSLVQILTTERDEQVVITTHSADIVDRVPLESLRVVWNENGISQVAPVAEHTKTPVLSGLITPGELLRSDALDPETV